MEGSDTADGGRIAQAVKMEKFDKRIEQREEKKKVNRKTKKRGGKQEQVVTLKMQFKTTPTYFSVR
jgi:hypothetical protein